MRFLNSSPFQPATSPASGGQNAPAPSVAPPTAVPAAMSPELSATTHAAAPAVVVPPSAATAKAAVAPAGADATALAAHPHAPAKSSVAVPSKAAKSAPVPASVPPSEHVSAPVAAVEGGLGNIGSSATRFWEWATQRSAAATSHARPWIEFFDLSAFGPSSSSGIGPYIERVKANVPYFLFNYIIFGLVLTLLATVTQPLALVGSFLLVLAYFHLFGSAAPEEVPFMGLSLDRNEKVGALIVLAFIVFWLTAGALSIFVTAATSTIFIAVLHGSLRVPPTEPRSFV
jgi:hypothetical protein